MRSKTSFFNKYIFLLIIFLSVLAFLISRFTINFIEFEGDLSYIDLNSSRVSGLILLKNKNLLVSNRQQFESELRKENPEVSKIEIFPKSISTISIKITNHDICCVIVDTNTNKFLISSEGRVLKQLNRENNYPVEINLSQVVDLNSSFSINSLKKIVEIENILIDKKLDVAEINVENDKIVFKLKSDQLVIIDPEVNTKNFMEKLFTMIDYLKQKNLEFKKMDFRFGNVVVE